MALRRFYCNITCPISARVDVVLLLPSSGLSHSVSPTSIKTFKIKPHVETVLLKMNQTKRMQLVQNIIQNKNKAVSVNHHTASQTVLVLVVDHHPAEIHK